MDGLAMGTLAMKGVLVIFAVLLVVGTGILVPAFTVAVAYLYFGDVRVSAVGSSGRTAGSLGLVDPNEAARAVGSWG